MLHDVLDCFRDLQNYTTLKHIKMRTFHFYGFRDLQNYTTLKPDVTLPDIEFSFRDLQNYTTLKLAA